MLEASLMSAVRIVKSLLTLDLSRQIERVKIDNAVQSLRQIFFFSPELRCALESMSDGESVDIETAEYFAEQFRNVPFRIENALTFLRTERFEDAQHVLIDDIQMMEEINYGKINIRKEISRFFRDFVDHNRAGQRQKKYRDEAARLLGQIDRLNNVIRECEEKLLAARKGGAGTLPRPSTRHSPVNSTPSSKKSKKSKKSKAGR
jgi:hypothetical protein